jgi:hypothetical protein
MAKKCPSGAICVENNTMYFIIIVLLIGASIVYLTTRMSSREKDYTKTNYIMGFPSPFNLDFIPKLGSGITYANDMLNNPYVPPLKNENIYTSYGDIRPDVALNYGNVPINVNTRHYDSSYRQVGFLSPDAGGNGAPGNALKDNLIPLMGRPLDRSRDKWNFYSINNSNNNLKLPIIHKGKSCTNEYGCDNLYNGDTVYVEGLKQPFTATLYDTETMKYLPFV